MKILNAWRWLAQAPTQCASCGADVLPYLPRCVSCGAEIPQQMSEIVLPQEDDFALRPGAVRIGHLSDLHIGMNGPAPLRPMPIFRMWLERFARVGVQLVVVSGDLVERPGDVFGLQQARALLEECGMQWVVVPGNHDIKRPGYHDPFNDVFGPFPRVEQHCGLTFVLLDSMAGLSLEERDLSERMYGDYVCYTEGRIGAEQYAYVSRQLAALEQQQPLDSAGERVLVLHHHVMRQHADLMPHVPKKANISEDMFGTMKTLLDVDALFAWAAQHNIHTIMHGHKHLFQQPGMRGNNLLILNAGTSTLRPGAQLARLMDIELGGDKVLMNVELPL